MDIRSENLTKNSSQARNGDIDISRPTVKVSIATNLFYSFTQEGRSGLVHYSVHTTKLSLSLSLLLASVIPELNHNRVA